MAHKQLILSDGLPKQLGYWGEDEAINMKYRSICTKHIKKCLESPAQPENNPCQAIDAAMLAVLREAKVGGVKSEGLSKASDVVFEVAMRHTIDSGDLNSLELNTDNGVLMLRVTVGPKETILSLTRKSESLSDIRHIVTIANSEAAILMRGINGLWADGSIFRQFSIKMRDGQKIVCKNEFMYGGQRIALELPFLYHGREEQYVVDLNWLEQKTLSYFLFKKLPRQR